MRIFSHPVSDEQLLAYAAHELDTVQSTAIASHIAQCASCTARLARLDHLRRLMRNDQSWTPPAPALKRAQNLFTTLRPNYRRSRLALGQSFLRAIWARQNPVALRTAGAALIVTVAIIYGLIFALQSALPGDSIYPVKLQVEGLQLALAPDETSRVQLQLSFTHNRLEEIKSLVTQRRYDQIRPAVERYESQAKSVTDSLRQVAQQDSARANALAPETHATLSQAEATLAELSESGPTEVKPLLSHALDSSLTDAATVQAQFPAVTQVVQPTSDRVPEAALSSTQTPTPVKSTEQPLPASTGLPKSTPRQSPPSTPIGPAVASPSTPTLAAPATALLPSPSPSPTMTASTTDTATPAPSTATATPVTPAVPPSDTPTATVVPATDTPMPPTGTSVPPSDTSTATVVPATDTPIPPTDTPTDTPTPTAVPATATPVPPTDTPTDTPTPTAVPATATPIPPTDTPTDTPTPTAVPATATPIPPSGTPTSTVVPATYTSVPPTDTPTLTVVPATNTPIPPSGTPTPTTVPPTDTPVPLPPTATPTLITPQVSFNNQTQAICQAAPEQLVARGKVRLPDGMHARLQTYWFIAQPDDKRIPPDYQQHPVTQDGESFAVTISWPGIRPTDKAVQVSVGAILLDASDSPISQAASASFYWEPSVCPAPSAKLTPGSSK